MRAERGDGIVRRRSAADGSRLAASCATAKRRPLLSAYLRHPMVSVEIGAAAPSGGLDHVGISQAARAARPVRSGISRLVARARLLDTGPHQIVRHVLVTPLDREPAAAGTVFLKLLQHDLTNNGAPVGR